MAIKNLENPVFHLDDPSTGGPLIGGKVYVYAAGNTTPITTWQDSTQTTANTNPVILDSYGNAKIWFDQTAKIVTKNSDDSITYYTFDNVSPVGGTTIISGDYNLIQNGSFEATETDGTPSQWTVTLNDPTVTILTDTTNVSHGKQSVKFDGQTGLGGGNIVSQKFDVSVNKLVQVSLYTMASNATTTNDVQILWYQKDDTASTTPSTTLGLPAEGSYPTSMTSYIFFTAAPSDATRAEIKITGIDSGGSNLDADVYFDNVFVYDNANLPSALGLVEASKLVTADANAYITHDTSAAEKRVNFYNGVSDIYLRGLTNGDLEVYDATNTRTAWKYDVSDNRLITAPNIQCTVTDGDLTFQRNGTGDITVDTIPIYGMVFLAVPVALVNAVATKGSWTSVDVSAVHAAADGAKAVLLTIRSSSSALVYTSLRPTGQTTGATAVGTEVVYGDSTDGAGFAIQATDSNGDFDWQTNSSGTTSTSIYLTGFIK